LFDFISKIIFDENKKELHDKEFNFIIKILLAILIFLFLCIVATENIEYIKNILSSFKTKGS
jgi:hypothetical protein